MTSRRPEASCLRKITLYKRIVFNQKFKKLWNETGASFDSQSLYAQCLCISLYSTHMELFLGTVEPWLFGPVGTRLNSLDIQEDGQSRTIPKLHSRNGINIVSVHLLCLMGKSFYGSWMWLINIYEKIEPDKQVQITKEYQ